MQLSSWTDLKPQGPASMPVDLHMCVGWFLLRPMCEDHAQFGGGKRLKSKGRPFFNT